MSQSCVLIVEDTPHNMDLMRYLLQARGYRTAEAVTGGAALEIARRERPDLVILDLQLPDMDGFAVLEMLRGDPDLAARPIVAVTAFAMVGDRDRILARGFDGYIPKPIEPQTFAIEVEGHLPPARRARAPGPRVHLREPDEEQPKRAADRGLVLVVDNLEANRHLARSILQPFGYEVAGASAVPEALSLLDEKVPRLILCDVHMPGGDGFGLLQAVRGDERTRAVPFVFLSATGGHDDVVKGLALGADDFIVRPLDPRALLERVAALTGQKGEQNQADRSREMEAGDGAGGRQ